MRNPKLTAAVLGVCASATLGFATPVAAEASAAQPLSGVGVAKVMQFRHDLTNRCLDGSATQGIRIVACNGTDYQRWDLIADTPGVVRFKHVQSRRCLDGSVTQGARLVACNGGAYQRWDLEQGGIRHVQSGRCLDASISQGVRLLPCNGSVYQDWDIR